MPSCLGFYTNKNMIKYAKVNRDKNSGLYTLEAYGVKFYDNIMSTIDAIATEVGIDQCTVSSALTNEGYHNVEVFSGLKPKDRNDLIESEFYSYCEKAGLVPTALEFRHQLVQNTGNPDKFTAICSYVSKGELAGINSNYDGFKISSVAPLALSVGNLFPNKGIDEESVVVNIESKTTVTLFLRSEIQTVIEIPLGMDDIMDKLAEKYNSYAKAYEACKKVSVYIDDVTTLDEESRDILDVILPVFYDIRQRVDTAIVPYKRLIKSIYITGTAVTVNNVDLYFKENFPSLRCEILKPFFLSRADSSIQKEIVEVNSAIAIALNGLGMVDPNIDFDSAAKKAMIMTQFKMIESVKATTASIKTKVKGKYEDFLEMIKPKTKGNGSSIRNESFIKKLANKVNKKSKGKVRVAFDAGVNMQAGDYGDMSADTGGKDELTRFDGVLIRSAIYCALIAIAYVVTASIVSSTLENNIKEADIIISKVKSEISKAEEDANYIKTKSAEYEAKTAKLNEVMEEIETEKRKSNFDIPNFMSQLMFIIPQGVTITNINVSELGEVEIDAMSTQYAQLGYFVSRIKLEKVLNDVDMTVVEMQQNIRIKIGGMLP